MPVKLWINFAIAFLSFLCFNFISKFTLKKTKKFSFEFFCFFFLLEFSFTDTDDSPGSRERVGTILFHSITSTRTRTFKYSFATLHVRWLSHVFNRTPCIYQTATRWDLPPYRVTIWSIDDVMLIFVCLLDNLILGFSYSNLTQKTGGLELPSSITLVLQVNRLTKSPLSRKHRFI